MTPNGVAIVRLIDQVGGIVAISLSIVALKAGSGIHEWDISVLGASHVNKVRKRPRWNTETVLSKT